MSLRTRIFLAFAGAVTAGFIALVYWVRDDLRPRYLESLEEPLVDTAQVLAELLADDVGSQAGQTELHEAFERAYARRFTARVFALERDRVDMRVYVTDAKGIVVFDSAKRDEGRDFSRWNDVMRTLRGEYGARSSRDDPLDPVNAVVYVAAPILVDGRITGVVSVGKSKRNIGQFVRAAQRQVLIAGIVAALAVLLVGLTLTVWLTRPLERLRAYAQSVAAGQPAVLPALGRSEIGQMGRAIEDMRIALEGKDYVEAYVQTLTHELKSPLAAIRGAAELLTEDLPLEERKRFLQNIRREAQRIEDLIERLLSQARLEKLQTLERRELIPLEALVAGIRESLQPSLRAKEARLQVDVPAAVSLRGDPFLVRQAIANLLDNAIAFSATGGTIELSAGQDGPFIELRIRDHGPGIPDYALARIFERFYSLPRPETSRKSTGLGLSFVREVAKLHGGGIRLHNHPDGGAEAVLRLPGT